MQYAGDAVEQAREVNGKRISHLNKMIDGRLCVVVEDEDARDMATDEAKH